MSKDSVANWASGNSMQLVVNNPETFQQEEGEKNENFEEERDLL